MLGHEHTGTTHFVGALTASTEDLVVLIYLVELEDSKFDTLVLVMGLLGLGVHFFLSLLGTTTQTEHQMQGAFLLNVVVLKSTANLQLLTSEDKTLLIRGDSFLVLNLGLDVVNGVSGFDIQGDGLSGQSSTSNGKSKIQLV